MSTDNTANVTVKDIAWTVNYEFCMGEVSLDEIFATVGDCPEDFSSVLSDRVKSEIIQKIYAEIEKENSRLQDAYAADCFSLAQLDKRRVA